MRKLLVPALTAAALLGLAYPSQAQDKDARAIIDKAIKASGGEAALAKTNKAQAKAKGSVTIGNMELPFTMEAWTNVPTQSRMEITFDLGGMKLKAVEVYDNGKGWSAQNADVKEADKETLDESKLSLYVSRLTSLTPLLNDKSLELSVIGEEKVNGKPAVGIKVASKEHKEVKIYFDKESGLVVKVSRPGMDPINKVAVKQDEYYSNYKAVDGAQVPMKMQIQLDGNRFIDAEFTEVRFVQSFPEKTFTKPQ